MSAAATQMRRSSVLLGGVSFITQVCIAISFEVVDDLARGHFAQHGTSAGVENAHRLIAFETAHGFFVEPAWQMFFLQTRHILSLTITWLAMAHVMNAIYVGGHVGVTLGVAFWVYIARRRFFALLRNTVILVNLFSLFVYENIPVAPPRLTPNVIFEGHRFRFQDTVFGIMDSSGHIIGSEHGFNEFSAMPSVHMAWALVSGIALMCLGRALWARSFGAIYPALMLIAIVVTGNHYLMDAAGGAGIVALSLFVAGSVEIYRGKLSLPWRKPSTSVNGTERVGKDGQNTYRLRDGDTS